MLVYAPIKIYLQKEVEGQIWPVGYGLLSPGLGNNQDLHTSIARGPRKTASTTASGTPIRSWKELSSLLKDC